MKARTAALAALLTLIAACGGGDGKEDAADTEPVEDEPVETTTTTEPGDSVFELHDTRGGTCTNYEAVPAGLFVFEHCDTTTRAFRPDQTPARTFGEFPRLTTTRPLSDGTVYGLEVVKEVEGGIASSLVDLKVRVVTFTADTDAGNPPTEVVIDIPDVEDGTEYTIDDIRPLPDGRIAFVGDDNPFWVLINLTNNTATYVNVEDTDGDNFGRYADRTITWETNGDGPTYISANGDDPNAVPELEPVAIPEGWTAATLSRWTGPTVFHNEIVITNETQVATLTPDGTVTPFPNNHPLTLASNEHVSGLITNNGQYFYAFNALSGDIEIWDRNEQQAVLGGAASLVADDPAAEGTLAAIGEWEFARTEGDIAVLAVDDHGEIALAPDGTYHLPGLPCTTGDLNDRTVTSAVNQTWFIDLCDTTRQWTALDPETTNTPPETTLPHR